MRKTETRIVNEDTKVTVGEMTNEEIQLNRLFKEKLERMSWWQKFTLDYPRFYLRFTAAFWEAKYWATKTQYEQYKAEVMRRMYQEGKRDGKE